MFILVYLIFKGVKIQKNSVIVLFFVFLYFCIFVFLFISHIYDKVLHIGMVYTYNP
jgi:hypothetical protein